MGRRVLIFVEGYQRGNGLLYAQAAQRLGLHPITLSTDPGQYSYLAEERLEAIRVDTHNLDTLIRECSRLAATYDIAGITGFTTLDERTYATVGKLCRHFDLAGPDPAAIERCCDKFTQRHLLAEAGVPVPAYRVAANAKDVESATAEIGLPVILKPAEGHGCMGVRLCRNMDELAEHTAYLLHGEHMWQSLSKVLVEEFAQGDFYCAEIMGDEVVGIAGTVFGQLPHFVFQQTTIPAHLSDGEHEHLTELSSRCLRALGLGWGPSNIEFRWTKRGPVVIEVNPRLAGAPDPQLVKLAYGVDFITEHIKLLIGDDCNLRRRHSQTSAVRYLVPDREGTLDWIVGDGRAAAVPGVAEVKLFVEAKTPIVRYGDYRDCIGHVVAASANLAQTEAILQRAVDLIQWAITPFPALGD
ncbi:acetyl-CoA carboxylase biotin carboxylase subunit family protein [Ensifer sp. IC3342]|nr:acetyl-CoA carboxylase biotin carboxylase subunit family protein [Ensifer sp. BRP08]MCA1451360.1 acetyl-CoA carboxylase biotin carboxylase subunit family protein [Ensifer sp. IC3342]